MRTIQVVRKLRDEARAARPATTVEAIRKATEDLSPEGIAGVIDDLAAEVAAKDGVSKSVAYDRVLRTKEGAALRAEHARRTGHVREATEWGGVVPRLRRFSG